MKVPNFNDGYKEIYVAEKSGIAYIILTCSLDCAYEIKHGVFKGFLVYGTRWLRKSRWSH